MNSYAKRGGAARRRFCVICKKPEGGAEINPPPGVRVLIPNAGSIRRTLAVTNRDIGTLYLSVITLYLIVRAQQSSSSTAG